jgi:hypothetical protein
MRVQTKINLIMFDLHSFKKFSNKSIEVVSILIFNFYLKQTNKAEILLAKKLRS